jgi:hypothetical protein
LLHKRAFEKSSDCHAAAQFVEERIGGGGENKMVMLQERREEEGESFCFLLL